MLTNVGQRYENAIRRAGQKHPSYFAWQTAHQVDAAGNNGSRNAALFVEQSGF
uniref:hypothetical protein n=1 Tax=Prevotella sp. TaxID=59823 RepID=UPI003FEDD3E3